MVFWVVVDIELKLCFHLTDLKLSILLQGLELGLLIKPLPTPSLTTSRIWLSPQSWISVPLIAWLNALTRYPIGGCVVCVRLCPRGASLIVGCSRWIEGKERWKGLGRVAILYLQ